MVKFLWFCLAGSIAGVLGGMGMGGGTVLIPLLSVFYSVSQHFAQGVNLLSFIPMAIASLIVHFKNGFVKVKDVLTAVPSSIVGGVVGSLLSGLIDGNVLKRIFGGFLILIACLEFFGDKIQKKFSEKPLKDG